MKISISEELKREHELIKTILQQTRKLVENSNQIREISLFELASQIVDFVEVFVDDYHHSKEEDILFAQLSEPGVLQHCNPIGQMLYEHDTSREYLEQIKGAIETKNAGVLSENLVSYCDLLEQHIFKEDNILYPMAENNLADDTKQAMQSAYEQLEDRKESGLLWAKYQKLADVLRSYIGDISTVQL